MARLRLLPGYFWVLGPDRWIGRDPWRRGPRTPGAVAGQRDFSGAGDGGPNRGVRHRRGRLHPHRASADRTRGDHRRVTPSDRGPARGRRGTAGRHGRLFRPRSTDRAICRFPPGGRRRERDRAARPLPAQQPRPHARGARSFPRRLALLLRRPDEWPESGWANRLGKHPGRFGRRPRPGRACRRRLYPARSRRRPGAPQARRAPASHRAVAQPVPARAGARDDL